MFLVHLRAASVKVQKPHSVGALLGAWGPPPSWGRCYILKPGLLTSTAMSTTNLEITWPTIVSVICHGNLLGNTILQLAVNSSSHWVQVWISRYSRYICCIYILYYILHIFLVGPFIMVLAGLRSASWNMSRPSPNIRMPGPGTSLGPGSISVGVMCGVVECLASPGCIEDNTHSSQSPTFASEF